MISFVVPVFNEEESLEAFFTELSHVAPTLAQQYEYVFVDDGSTDTSLSILQGLTTKHKNVRAFSFRKNLGKAEALTYGFMQAHGDLIITLDADLQDKPSEIHKLLAKHNEGYEVVSGWRRDRKDKSKMVAISRMFNTLTGSFFGLKLHDYNCGLKLYTKDAAKSLRLYGGLHRFIPLLVYQQGFTVDEVAIEHAKRKFGKSKYGFSKLWKDLPDMFTMLFLVKYSKRPLHFFGMIGGIIGLVGIVILLYLSVLHFLGVSIGRRPLLIFGMLFVISGIQIFFSCFLADLMINIAHSPRLLDESQMHYPVKYSSDRSKKS